MDRDMMSDTGTTDPARKQPIVPEWKVVNVVCTAIVGIDEKMDLNAIARTYPDSKYNPERFPGLITESKQPKATVLLFSTGKMVVTGLKHVKDARQVVDGVIGMMKKTGIKVNGEPTITVQNFVASGDLGVQLNLDDASLTLGNVVYEPEVFPGAIYRMIEPKSVVLLFSTGRFVVTGIKSENQIKEAVTKLVTVINENDLNQVEPKDEDFLI